MMGVPERDFEETSLDKEMLKYRRLARLHVRCIWDTPPLFYATTLTVPSGSHPTIGLGQNLFVTGAPCLTFTVGSAPVQTLGFSVFTDEITLMKARSTR